MILPYDRSPRRKRVAHWLTLGACAAALMVAATEIQAATPPAPIFRPTSDLDLPAITRLIVSRSSSIQSAQLDVELAGAEVRQSELWENPAIDASWATIPLGETNPSGLESPYGNIPNYGVGVSYRFLLGKRGPRQDRARALEGGARAMRDASARAQALELVRLLGAVAAARMRADGAQGVLEDAKHSLELSKARLASSFGTPLDVDRMQIEVSRVEQVILRSEGEVNAGLAACAAALGMTCEGFADRDTAKHFLSRWVDRGLSAPVEPLVQRPDLRALESYEKAASAELDLAHAMSYPDPTVRLGYVHDRFVVSGNQQNSLNLAVSVPIPVLDHGQALAQAASSRRARLGNQRERLLQATRARIPQLRKTLEIQRQRERAIVTEMLPRARAVLQDLEHAASNRLVALTDVIQARRTMHDLLLEEADSIGNAFEASIELLSQLPGTAVSTDPGQRR